MATLVDTTTSLDIVLIDVAMPEWTPDNDSFDWSAFNATFAALPQTVVHGPELDENGNIVTTPNTVTTAPDDPESGWNPDTMVFITNAEGESADFTVSYDAAGVPHYSIPADTEAWRIPILQEDFKDWL